MRELMGVLLLAFVPLLASAQVSELDLVTKQNLQMQQVTANASSVSVQGLTGFQAGNGNSQRITNQGEGNQLQIIQEGNLNSIQMQLEGSGNRQQFIQQGNRNSLDLRGVQATNSSLQIIQRGEGNQLTDTGSSLLRSPIRIEQSGGMRILINGN